MLYTLPPFVPLPAFVCPSQQLITSGDLVAEGGTSGLDGPEALLNTPMPPAGEETKALSMTPTTMTTARGIPIHPHAQHHPPALDPALPLDDARRVSFDSVYSRRPSALPLPLDSQPLPQLPPLPPQHASAETQRHVTPSRLATPGRFGTHVGATSRLLRSALPSSALGLPRSWGTAPTSPTSRAPSAIGSAVDRLARPCTSEGRTLEGRPTARERLGYSSRNRNCSASVGGKNSERVASPGPRAMEWLGPRTAKAFAAAGLLDHDPNSPGSRFGSVRSLGDHDQRVLSPSRIAISEAGSVASSWRSGSVSHAMTHSEATCHDSASTSTGAPRTTRSAESTAIVLFAIKLDWILAAVTFVIMVTYGEFLWSC